MAVALNPTRDALLSVARSLPPAAQIIAGICELLQDVNTDLDQIADEIRMDAALAARVIRISNSVIYGGGGSVASVEEAVGRVGFSEVVRLVGTATVNRLVDKELINYHVSVDVMRETLLMHALASEALAEAIGMDRNTAYVGGLLRGIGMMVLDRFAGTKLAAHQTFDPIEYQTYTAWETACFGISSTRVTTMTLDDWRFPEETVAALEAHLEPPDAMDAADRLANVLNLAGTIATEHGRSLPGEVVFWSNPEARIAYLNLEHDHYEGIAQRTVEIFEQQRQALY